MILPAYLNTLSPAYLPNLETAFLTSDLSEIVSFPSDPSLVKLLTDTPSSRKNVVGSLLSDPLVSHVASILAAPNSVSPIAVNVLTFSKPLDLDSQTIGTITSFHDRISSSEESFRSLDHKLIEYLDINIHKYTVCNECTNVINVASEVVLLNKTDKGTSTELEVKHDTDEVASGLAMMTTATVTSIQTNSTEFVKEEISLEDSASINDVVHPSETLYLSITRGESVTAAMEDQINIDKLTSMSQEELISGNEEDKPQAENKTGEKSGLNNLQQPTTLLNSSDLYQANATASSGINQTTENHTDWTQSQAGKNSFLNSNISAVKTTTEIMSALKTTTQFVPSSIAHSHASSSGIPSIAHSHAPSSGIPSCENNVFSRTPLSKATTEKNKVDSRFPVVYLEVVSSHILPQEMDPEG